MPPKTDRGPTAVELARLVAEKTGLTKQQVDEVFDALASVIVGQVKKKSSIKLFGLVKIGVKSRAARPARQGRNPATGEAITIKAKPAGHAVKAAPLKTLKELV